MIEEKEQRSYDKTDLLEQLIYFDLGLISVGGAVRFYGSILAFLDEH